MFPIPLGTSCDRLSKEQFWNVLSLYHNRPHLVNRRIIAVSQALFCKVKFSAGSVQLEWLINRASVLYELRKLDSLSSDAITEQFLVNLLEAYDKNVKLQNVSFEDFKKYSKGTFVSVRVLFPKAKDSSRAVEVVMFDKEQRKVVFLVVSDSDKQYLGPPFPYEIQLNKEGYLKLNLITFENAETSHADWLVDKLFGKLLKWLDNDSNTNKSGVSSLSLIDVDQYCILYEKLKRQYGAKLVQEWPKKAGTDPQKYVFEDIAIATYLMCLWKSEKNINFVDCGCGNGLLVYLLNQEGYEGVGCDVRRRNTWDIFPETTKLKVETVTQSSTFPHSTWLIGNHSDELSPWIPIIAAKSGPNTNFFLLPCCPFDLNGRKFVRRNTSVSAYSDYCSYLQSLSEKCGFRVNVDKLRIPSTKRMCLVGRREAEGSQNTLDILIPVEDITYRSDKERVRNCTQLDKDLIFNLLLACVNTLLAKEDLIIKADGISMWNRGGEVSISELAQQIELDKLQKLKQECGGLQTLLKNHRFIFELSKGLVKIRLPIKKQDSTKYCDKPCWFKENHPNGCLYEDLVCGYKH